MLGRLGLPLLLPDTVCDPVAITAREPSSLATTLGYAWLSLAVVAHIMASLFNVGGRLLSSSRATAGSLGAGSPRKPTQPTSGRESRRLTRSGLSCAVEPGRRSRAAEPTRSSQRSVRQSMLKKSREQLVRRRLGKGVAPGRVLLQLAVGQATKAAYDDAIERFEAREAVEVADLVSQADTLDQKLTNYCDAMYLGGLDSYVGETLYAAIADRHPQLGKGGSQSLPLFARARQAWKRHAPGKTQAPLPWTAVLLIVDALLTGGLVGLALMVLVSFNTYFRPSETLGLRCRDLVRPGGSVLHWGLQLHPQERMKASKTDQFDDGVLLDNPRMPYLGDALHQYTAARQKQDNAGVEALIFPFAYLSAATSFKEAGARAGVQDCRLYRLRHGGASHDVAAKLRSLLEVK